MDVATLQAQIGKSYPPGEWVTLAHGLLIQALVRKPACYAEMVALLYP